MTSGMDAANGSKPSDVDVSLVHSKPDRNSSSLKHVSRHSVFSTAHPCATHDCSADVTFERNMEETGWSGPTAVVIIRRASTGYRVYLCV